MKKRWWILPWAVSSVISSSFVISIWVLTWGQFPKAIAFINFYTTEILTDWSGRQSSTNPSAWRLSPRGQLLICWQEPRQWHQLVVIVLGFLFLFFFLNHHLRIFFPLFFLARMGVGERNINMRDTLVASGVCSDQLGPGMEPAAQVHALDLNRTCDHLVCGLEV